jgi:peptidoglycan/LPS O-acetylase OafA/YrhL
MLLYELLTFTDLRRRLSGRGEAVALLLFAAGLALVSLLDVWQPRFLFLPGLGRLYSFYCMVVLSIAFPGFLAYALTYPGLSQSLCCWTPLRWLGNMSYSYYLLHGLTLKGLALVVTRFHPPSGHQPALFTLLLAVGLTATLATSTVLFLLVEKPFSLRKPAKKLPAPSSLEAELQAVAAAKQG